MMKPVVVVSKFSAAARMPTSDPCSPLPRARMVTPSSNAQTCRVLPHIDVPPEDSATACRISLTELRRRRPRAAQSGPRLNCPDLPKLQFDDRGVEGLHETFRGAAPDGPADDACLRPVGIDQNLGRRAALGPVQAPDQVEAVEAVDRFRHHDEIGRPCPRYRERLLGIFRDSELEAIGHEKPNQFLPVLIIASDDKALPQWD